jgi:hypothetical protein
MRLYAIKIFVITLAFYCTLSAVEARVKLTCRMTFNFVAPSTETAASPVKFVELLRCRRAADARMAALPSEH